jgi:hypothetical protein
MSTHQGIKKFACTARIFVQLPPPRADYKYSTLLQLAITVAGCECVPLRALETHRRFSPLLVTVRATALPVKAVAWKAVATLRDATAATHATACTRKHANTQKCLVCEKCCIDSIVAISKFSAA